VAVRYQLDTFITSAQGLRIGEYGRNVY